MTTVPERIISAAAAAGLAALAVLCVSGGSVRADPPASPAFVASQGARSDPAVRPEGSAGDHEQGRGSGAGRITLVAVAAAALGAFTVLQVMARSRYRRKHDSLDPRTRPPTRDPGPRTAHGDQAARDQQRPPRQHGYCD